MMKIEYSSQFKRDCKRAKASGYDMNKLDTVINMLASGTSLPDRYRDHALNNSKHYKNCRECHVSPDQLLVYRISNNRLILECVRFGSHSELFGADDLIFL